MSDVCVFSGARQPPPLGFPKKPKLKFLHGGKFPTASTCAFIFSIPIHSTYDAFREAMLLGILGNDGFGGP